MENLNDKVWYRFLKVVFIIAFIVFQFGVLYSGFPQKYVYRCNNGKIIPLSHNSTINDSYTFRLDKECDPNVIVPTYDKNGNYTEEWMHNYVENWRGVYVADYLTALWLVPLVFTGISFWFWFISRLFFYIFIKEKFFSGKLVNIIKGIFIKK